MGKHEFSRPSGDALPKNGRSLFGGTARLACAALMGIISAVGFVAASGGASASTLPTFGTPTLTAWSDCNNGVFFDASQFNPAQTHEATVIIGGQVVEDVTFTTALSDSDVWQGDSIGTSWLVKVTNPALTISGVQEATPCTQPKQTVTGPPWGSPPTSSSTSPTTSPSSSSSSTTSPVGTKTIKVNQSSLDQSCPQGTTITAYNFVITSKGAEPPDYIVVVLANGQTYTVKRDGLPSATAHYRLHVTNGGAVLGAWATVPSSWSGRFNLSDLSCTVTTPPSSSSSTSPSTSPTTSPTTSPSTSPSSSPSSSSTSPTTPPSSTSTSTTAPPSSTTSTSPTSKPSGTTSTTTQPVAPTSTHKPKPSSTAVGTTPSSSKYTPGPGRTGSDTTSGGVSPAQIMFAAIFAGSWALGTNGALKRRRERAGK